MPLDSNNQNTSRTRSVSRRTWLKTTGTAAISLAAGCIGNSEDGGSSDGGETVIEYWRWPHSTEPSNTAENQIVNAFNKLDNGIRVKQVLTPYQKFNTKLKTAIAGGSAPEVAWNLEPNVIYDTTGKSREQIANNAPYVYLDDLLDDSFQEQFWEAYWRRRYKRYKGIITVPFIGGVDPGFLYVNLDAWKKSGLGELPRDSWTFEEFHQAIKAMNRVKSYGWVIGLQGLQTRNRWVTIMQRARMFGKIIGAGFLNQNGKYTLTMADDAMVDLWNAWYQTPINKDWTNPPFAYKEIGKLQPFYAGQAGMIAQSSWARVGIEKKGDFEWDILPFPTKNGNDYWLRNAGGAGMSAFRKDIGGNPKPAAKFIQFRTKAENAYKFFNVSGQAIPNKAAYKMLKEKGVSDFVKKTKAMAVMEALKNSLEASAEITKLRKKRYPSIKTAKVQGYSVLDKGIPRGAGGGKLQQQTATQMQKMVKGKDTKQGFIDIEKAWQETLTGSGYPVEDGSVGYNNPPPDYK
jgi:ABC-type glycerol-3-phosphate transport system substrate-binding protein